MNAQVSEAVREASTAGLFRDYSLEITAKDAAELRDTAELIPPGSQVSITFLPGEGMQARVDAACEVARLGFVPVPHVAARGLRSAEELGSFLERLRAEARVERVFVIAGDTPGGDGPFRDSLDVIRSGALAEHGIALVGVAGYPEPHPKIPREKLWAALQLKQQILQDLGHEMEIVTQFGFDADPILSWLQRLRAEGIYAPVRVGLAGPTSVKTLLRFAARCGVGTSAKVLSKYGISVTKLFGSAGPDLVTNDLLAALDPAIHGVVKLHLYPFGGLAKAAGWARAFSVRSPAQLLPIH